MKGVQVISVLPQGVGTPYTRRYSIPHGFPMPMMVLALIMRPWILLKRQMGIMPLTLADDLVLVIRGPNSPGDQADNMLETFTVAVDASLD